MSLFVREPAFIPITFQHRTGLSIRDACQISERLEKSNHRFYALEISRDLARRRLIGDLNGKLGVYVTSEDANLAKNPSSSHVRVFAIVKERYNFMHV